MACSNVRVSNLKGRSEAPLDGLLPGPPTTEATAYNRAAFEVNQEIPG
jgi:hypothetical protein